MSLLITYWWITPVPFCHEPYLWNIILSLRTINHTLSLLSLFSLLLSLSSSFSSLSDTLLPTLFTVNRYEFTDSWTVGYTLSLGLNNPLCSGSLKPCKNFISTPNYHIQKGYVDFVPEQLIYVSGSINRNVPFFKAGLTNSVNLIVFTVFSICNQKAELHFDAPKMGTRKTANSKSF